MTHTNKDGFGVPGRLCVVRAVGGWREVESMVSLCPSPIALRL